MENNTLETLSLLANKRGFQTHFYIDKLSVYFDASAPGTGLSQLISLSEKNQLIQPCTLEGHSYLCQKLELFQLDQNGFECLRGLCESSADYRFTYIELSLDFSSKSKKKVAVLRQFFNKHLVRLRKSKKRPPHFKNIKGTHYFNDKKDPIRMVMYSDKKFRWDESRFCVHLEYRYMGLDPVTSLGIVTIRDLLKFDHVAHWERQLDLRKPNFKEIGVHVAKGNVSDQALNKRGRKLFDDLDSLQRYLKDNLELVADKDQLNALFPPMNTEGALEKFLNF